jgi:hypothetical protein
MYEIEKNVPMPSNHGPKPAYPWRTMEVGDSFFVAVDKNSQRHRSICAQSSMAGKQLDRQFTTRWVDGGVRIWRTK